jgi:hypothetical protein
LTRVRANHAACEAEQPILRRYRMGEGVEPADHCRELPLFNEERVMARDELDRGVKVTGGGRMAGRVDDQARFAIPRAGASVQNREGIRFGRCQLVLEELAEQMVIPVPLAPGVERDEQQIRMFEFGEQRGRIRLACRRVAERPAEALQNRCPQQERPQLGRLPGEDLGRQIVDEITFVAGEALDQCARIRMPAKRERRQIERGRPALRPRLQPFDVRGRELQTEGIGQECRRLLVAEAKLAGTQLVQFATGAQLAQREWWVLPRCDDEAQADRRMLDEVGERLVDLRYCDHVVVVKDKREVAVEAGQVVEQQRQHDLDELGPRAAQSGQRTATDVGLDASQRRDHVGEKARRVVVVVVNR